MINPNPVPGLILTQPQTQAGNVQNNNSIIRYTKTISPRFYAVDTAMFSANSTPPPTPPTDAYIQIAGVQAVVFTSGSGTLTFPQTFPNGVLEAQVSAMYQFDPILASVTYPYAGGLGTLSLNGYDLSTASGAAGTVYIAYDAIGW